MIQSFRCDRETALVRTTKGLVKGYARDGLLIFKGIPYARARRFHAPQETEAWEGVFDATNYGFVCPLLENERPAAELRVPEDQAAALADYARSRLADEVAKGLTIAPDSDVTAGIRVLLDGGRVEHDFTEESVMEALSRVVRPSLAKLAFGK